jgi:hypothetical protein
MSPTPTPDLIPNPVTATKTVVEDIAERTLKTAFESAAGTAVVLWGGSGLNVRQLVTIAGIDKAWSVVGIGVFSAFAASAWNTLRAYMAIKKNRRAVIAVGKDYLDAAWTDVEKMLGHEPADTPPLNAGGGGGYFGAGPTIESDGTVEALPAEPGDESPQDVPVETPVLTPPETAAPATITVYDGSGNALGVVAQSEITNGQGTA